MHSDLSVNVASQDDRPKWDNKFQYLLTCIGFAVGLGNVWRFPYLCQSYGGGAFLIPYGIALVFEGIPLFHLELAIGQRLRKGSIGVWNTISPYLGGVGICSLIVSFLVGVYYNTILAWVLWYFFNCFQNPLPWSICPSNDNQTGELKECSESTPVDYFWYRKTLNISSDISKNGTLQWWLVICLAAAWGVVYMCTLRGIKSTGKAVYVTATFPYVVLTIFLIRGLTLPGAIDGLTYLFTPNMTVLMQPRVWLDAATQIFFSLSLGFGGLIAFSSYNAEKNIVSLMNNFDLTEESITRDNYNEWYGHLLSTFPSRTDKLNLKECRLQEFLDQSASGTGLAFIVFTEAIIQMPGSQVWAILFFIMLFSLGLSSMFGNVEGVLTPLLDLQIIPKSIPVEFLSGIICLISFGVSLLFTMASGNYWLQIFDSFTGSLTLLIVVFFEVITVSYVYGVERFCEDVKWMTGRSPNIYWKATWKFISPLLMLAVFLAYVFIQILTPLNYESWDPNYEDFPIKKKEEYPVWVVVICVLLVVIPCSFIPFVALYQFLKRTLIKRQKQEMDKYNSYDATNDQ
ncbi:sodium-dependent neutral amino acid transporter B(0)AT3-like isoform 2-T2 [Discoglossus pictus]